MEGEELLERRVSREDFLKLAAAAGGAGLLAGRAGAADAALARLAAESGRLQVMDWAGYEVKPLWAPVPEEVSGPETEVHVHDERGECVREAAGRLQA